MEIILKLITGEKIHCSLCGKLIEAETVFLDKIDENRKVNAVICLGCHDDH